MKIMAIEEQSAFGKKLIEAGLLTDKQWGEAIAGSERDNLFIADEIVKAGFLSKAKVYEVLAEIYGVPYVDVFNFQISAEALKNVPADLAHRYKVVPLFKIGNTLNVAMKNPADVSAVDHLAQKTRCTIDVCLGAAADIDTALNEHYGAASAVTTLLESFVQERTHKQLRPDFD